MVGLRAKLQKFAGRAALGEAGEAPQFGGISRPELLEKISDWSPARIERRMVLTRASCSGKYSFSGLKKQALLRMLQQATEQGPVTLIVMPMAPVYLKEFLTPTAMREFDRALTDVQRSHPEVQMIRLDQLAALNDNDRFYDFFHLNTSGQQIATAVFLSELK
jgi:hypothetical protein